jgi:hypothetical protein
MGRRALTAVAVVVVLLAIFGAASAAEPNADVTLKEDTAKWESGYGAKFFQVVGTLTNKGSRPIGAALVRVELLDEKGAVVAHADAWNAAAEQLGDLSGEAAQAKLKTLGAKPVAPGASDRFRVSFLEEETPKFKAHRSQVLATLPAP